MRSGSSGLPMQVPPESHAVSEAQDVPEIVSDSHQLESNEASLELRQHPASPPSASVAASAAATQAAAPPPAPMPSSSSSASAAAAATGPAPALKADEAVSASHSVHAAHPSTPTEHAAAPSNPVSESVSHAASASASLRHPSAESAASEGICDSRDAHAAAVGDQGRINPAAFRHSVHEASSEGPVAHADAAIDQGRTYPDNPESLRHLTAETSKDDHAARDARGAAAAGDQGRTEPDQLRHSASVCEEENDGSQPRSILLTSRDDLNDESFPSRDRCRSSSASIGAISDVETATTYIAVTSDRQTGSRTEAASFFATVSDRQTDAASVLGSSNSESPSPHSSAGGAPGFVGARYAAQEHQQAKAPSYARAALAALGGALPQRMQQVLPASLQAAIRDRRGYREHLFPGDTSSSGPDLGGLAIPADRTAVMRKVNRHLFTRFTILTVMCYLDRTNLAFAALQLNRDLGYTELVYGFGSSIFFVTYAAAQVPSNMILVRVGGALWLGIIVIGWGIVATCFAGLSSPASFYVLRLLLGLFEAGTFPGLWYMLTVFYTTSEVAVAYAICQSGSVAAQVVGAPLAAGLLALDGFLGLDGWQWLFIVEGIPTVAFGLWLRYTLADDPSTAAFLEPHERQWLAARNQSHKEASGEFADLEWDGILHWKTWALALLDTCISTTKYALLYFLPLIIYQILGERIDRAEAARRQHADGLPNGDDTHTAGEGKGPSEVIVALLTAIPFAAATAFTVADAWHSKRAGERRLHVVVPLFISAASMLVLALAMDSHAGLAFISLIGAVMAWAPGGILSAYPSAYLSGRAAASGWALVNAVGALLGGVAGPLIVGTLKHKTGNYSVSLLVLSAVMFGGAIFAYFLLPIISSDDIMRALPSASPKSQQLGDTGRTRVLSDDPSDSPTAHRLRVNEQSVQLTRLPSTP